MTTWKTTTATVAALTAAVGIFATTANAGTRGNYEPFNSNNHNQPAATRQLTTSSAQVTANVSAYYGASRQTAAIKKAATYGDVIGWQEICTPAQHQAISNLKNFNTYWPGGRNANGTVDDNFKNCGPISYDITKWKRVSEGHKLMSERVGWHISGGRYISWVVLEDRKTGVQIARWNVHFVPGGWHRTPIHHREIRQKVWYQQQAIVKDVVDRLDLDGKRIVVGGGDVNRSRVDFVGDIVKYDAVHNIDYIVSNKNRRVEFVNHHSTQFGSDHPLVVAKYKFSTEGKKAARKVKLR